MSVVINIGAYKDQDNKKAGSIGKRARFRPRPQRVGWIVQSVEIVVNLGETRETYEYTEAWRIISPSKIEQSGDDDFLVPKDWIRDYTGDMNIVTYAWYQKTLDADFKQGFQQNLWGRLHGTKILKTPPPNTPVLERFFVARWKRGGELKFDTQNTQLLPQLQR